LLEEDAVRLRTIVVGGSSGIGEAIAKRLSARDWLVMTMQRRPSIATPLYGHLDLKGSLQEIHDWIESAVEKLGGLDRLVISGGMGAYLHTVYEHVAIAEGEEDLARRFAKHSLKAEDMIRTHVTGPGYVLESAFGHLAKTNGRAIVIGSLIPRNCPADLAWYGASKAGIDAWVRAAGKQWARHGVKLNVFTTGWILTPMIGRIEPPRKRKIMRAIGTGRWGTVEEVARGVEWMLTDAPGYFTADILPMSGGL
jgi:NAD(P)-dependent dehydrogenase (short-subunit alcohol dehydrogenase family)